MEHAYWIEWRENSQMTMKGGRVYFGHETCELLLPELDTVSDVGQQLKESGIKLTFVTPFLTDKGLYKTCTLIDRLLMILGELEVVCNDWGLLQQLKERENIQPIIGRLLASQHTDPRILRILKQPTHTEPNRRVNEIDGASCQLRHKPPKETLRRHYRSCWLDKPNVMMYLANFGVRRCEISNTGQGIELERTTELCYSLHVPEVLVTVMRRCPTTGENFNKFLECNCHNCSKIEVLWQHSLIPVNLFRRGNAVFYNWKTLPNNLRMLPIDRIVHRNRSIL